MIETRDGYTPQRPETLGSYLSGIDPVRRILGGTPDQWSIAEVGDGNLNLVFIVKGPQGGVAVKQALPYVRLVGESWPLPLSRAHYEHMALTEQARLTGRLVPEILHYDESQALIVMELLEPHIIMRRGMIAAVVYPRFAEHISTFMARSLYFTSDLALKADAKKAMIGAFSLIISFSTRSASVAIAPIRMVSPSSSILSFPGIPLILTRVFGTSAKISCLIPPRISVPPAITAPSSLRSRAASS